VRSSRDPLARAMRVLRLTASNVARRYGMVGNDLEGYGHEALVRVLARYSPDRDATFNSYVSMSVRGAIMDGLREDHWFHGPEACELREALRVQLCESALVPDPEEVAIMCERSEHLREAIESLDVREGHLVFEHDVVGRDLCEAGRDLKMSKTRATRIHARAIAKLVECLGSVR